MVESAEAHSHRGDPPVFQAVPTAIALRLLKRQESGHGANACTRGARWLQNASHWKDVTACFPFDRSMEVGSSVENGTGGSPGTLG